MAILSIIAGIILPMISGVLDRALNTRADAELSQIATATKRFVIETGGVWPGDVDRGLPPGIEEYLGPGTWPNAPWNGAVYDYDSFTGSDGNPVYQISIRFCPLGQPQNCQFPDTDWATNFDYHSSYYFCISGICRSHPNKPDGHPGYCVNCE